MSQAQKTSKKNLWLIPLCILAAVALIAALVFASSAERKAVITKTLNTFYNALYVDSDWDALVGCIAEAKRDNFESAMSMGGVMPSFFFNYKQEAVLTLGEGFSVSVRLNELTEYGASEAAALQENFPGTEKAALAKYEIIFTTAQGDEQVYTNQMILIMVSGHWYMTTHLTLPIGANMTVGE